LKNTLQYVQELKKLVTQENIDDKLFEIASRFGALENALNEDDELAAILNDIKNILKKSLSSGRFDTNDKYELFSMFGKIEYHLEHLIKDSKKKTFNAAAAGLTAAAGARTLMKAGPMGMLAAGVLGVAGAYILQEGHEEPYISNQDLLTIAYYLSRFDHENLFDLNISSAKAIEALSDVLNVKPNTLRGKRDYFDSLIPQSQRKSNRKGYKEIKSPKVYNETIQKYKHISNEEEMRKIVIDILKKYQERLEL